MALTILHITMTTFALRKYKSTKRLTAEFICEGVVILPYWG
jgi:hypothetical protein